MSTEDAQTTESVRPTDADIKAAATALYAAGVTVPEGTSYADVVMDVLAAVNYPPGMTKAPTQRSEPSTQNLGEMRVEDDGTSEPCLCGSDFTCLARHEPPYPPVLRGSDEVDHG